MIKFVLILTSVVSFNFAVSFGKTETNTNQKSFELIFSQNPVAIESGQPVYPSGTKIWVSTKQTMEEIALQINEEEAVVKNEKKIDLSEITKIESGTYTIVVKADQERTFGFTIQ